MTFNPNDHIIKLQGKEYLEVKWRIVWFRQEHPDWGMQTEIVRYDDQRAVVRATVTDANGFVLAQAHKQEEPKHFGDFLEKAETGAVGRALGYLGYGTQFAPEFDEGDRVVDGPVAPKPAPQPRQPAPAPQAPRRTNAQIVAAKPIAEMSKEELEVEGSRRMSAILQSQLADMDEKAPMPQAMAVQSRPAPVEASPLIEAAIAERAKWMAGQPVCPDPVEEALDIISWRNDMLRVAEDWQWRDDRLKLTAPRMKKLADTLIAKAGSTEAATTFLGWTFGIERMKDLKEEQVVLLERFVQGENTEAFLALFLKLFAAEEQS